MANDSSTTLEYDYPPQDVTILRGVEHIRRNPGVYIGDVACQGLEYLLKEWVLLPLSHPEVSLPLRCIDAAIAQDGALSIAFDGWNCFATAAQEQMKSLFNGEPWPGGRFFLWGQVTYALSDRCSLTSIAAGRKVTMTFRHGQPAGWDEVACALEENRLLVSFHPDPQFFEDAQVRASACKEFLQPLAYLNPDLTIRLCVRRTDERESWHFPGGLSAYVRDLNREQNPLYPDVILLAEEIQGVRYAVAFQHVNDGPGRILSFVNNEATPLHGVHVTGFRAARTRILNAFRKKHHCFGKNAPTSKQYDNGLTAVVSIQGLTKPFYSHAFKHRLINPEVGQAMAQITRRQLGCILDKQPHLARAMIIQALRTT